MFPKKNINNNHDFSAENYSMFLYELLPNDIKAIFNYVQWQAKSSNAESHSCAILETNTNKK